MAYQGPGDAFSQGLEDVLIKRSVQRHNKLLEQLAVKREQRMEKADEMDIAMRREELADKQSERKLKQHLVRRSQLVAGDIPDKSMIDEAAALGIPLRLAQPTTQMAVGETEAMGMPPTSIPSGPPTFRGSPLEEARRTLADNITDNPQENIRGYLRFGLDPKEPEQISAAIRGPKPSAQPTLVAKDAQGNVIPGLISMDADGGALLNGAPLPEGVGVFRAPTATGMGSVHETANGLIRIGPDNSVIPIMRDGKPVRGYHPAPQPVVIQTSEGPALLNKGQGTTSPIKDRATGENVKPAVTAGTRAMMEGAQMLEPKIEHIQTLAAELDKRGLFGPVASRIRHVLTKAGTIDQFVSALSTDPEMAALASDPLVGQFETELSLLASGGGRVHGGQRGGGSIQMYNIFKGILSDSSSLAMFQGRIKGFNYYMSGYAAGPNGKDDAPPPAAAPPATGKYKRKIIGGD